MEHTKEIVLTGDRPTGCLHLGHYIGSLKNRIDLQNIYEKCYIMVADTQALSDNFNNPGKVIENVVEICKDYLAVGIDPLKSTIFIQSMIPELPELMLYYLNLVTLSRLERNPTVKSELQQREFGMSVPVGFLCYPVSQIADITAFKATIVPVGEDQLPMIELSNEVVRRFNITYNKSVLRESRALLGTTKRLVGIDGKSKASKSLNNAIFLCDSDEDIHDKVYRMFTDPDHIRVSDPGKVEGNVVFAYMDAFYEDREELEALKKHYQEGGLGDSSVKSLLSRSLQKLITPIRERRAEITKNYVMDILIDGTARARKEAAKTLGEVKEAIGIVYTRS
ncbi:MAG: tryptophan--tRNA ligase [Holosporales bacterium]|jgi:tryptophanyl-tRNA synthetase|nr:tryptophan--tRNA ligase [Holosporales bacterium]